MNGYDVAVIGGGPAGSTAGRLLAEWGYSVVLFNRLEKRKPSLAESLPPSTRKLFGFLGILQRLEDGRFYRSSGNTVWWADPEGSVERFGGSSQSWGYQVLRSDFDQLLLVDLRWQSSARYGTSKGRRVDYALSSELD